MKCPAGLKPFGHDNQGRPFPLIVPRDALKRAQRVYKGVWILPTTPLPR